MRFYRINGRLVDTQPPKASRIITLTASAAQAGIIGTNNVSRQKVGLKSPQAVAMNHSFRIECQACSFSLMPYGSVRAAVDTADRHAAQHGFTASAGPSSIVDLELLSYEETRR